jgi:hypothetical protein
MPTPRKTKQEKLTAEQRRLRASLAGHSSWGNPLQARAARLAFEESKNAPKKPRRIRRAATAKREEQIASIIERAPLLSTEQLARVATILESG